MLYYTIEKGREQISKMKGEKYSEDGHWFGAREKRGLVNMRSREK